MQAERPLTLVADIGGTNTRVALAQGAAVDTGTIERFRNADHRGLDAVLGDYLARRRSPPLAAACAALAGPVRDGRGTLTNLDWTIDENTLSQATGASRASLLNDLQAQGHALGLLDAQSVRQVIASPEGAAQESTRLVIGIGTGFNAAVVHEMDGMRMVTASESGHVTLPVRGDDDLRLSRFVEKAHGFPAVEDVLSGRGLVHVHDWLCAERGIDRRRSSAEIIADSGEDEVARQAVVQFVRILGGVAGDLSLIHLPFGGVSLVGGMARAMLPFFEMAGFTETFRAKGRFSSFMEQFGVDVIEDDYAALAGCAGYCAQRD
ncbi:Glucokinase [Profundibacterium mesophilum KAUST100406-0324]|uniref:Glucokinase n=1 Tax=Profundibacterium mesophilum KAUST100406-0324 TaxID=1037889 RepID=A0A921NY47_9RHOB|nr:glucokinase [Profundibacterium mesophilum]KAF0677501.1 Glucokinase [Profundibacterium mesophilum KAUST100406-0324]